MDDPVAGDLPLTPSLPKASYVGDDVFAEECEQVFLTDWFCAGREEAIPEIGDYLTVEVGGESVLVVRDRDGGLGAFYNLCRHRGTRLVPARPCQPSPSAGPSGSFHAAIRCPYHAWTYALDGTLRAAPFLPEARRHGETLSLHGAEVATWGGFVFVRLEPGPGGEEGPPLEAAVSGVAHRLANYPLEELRTGARLVYEVAANWKVVLENYNECYHCGPVHPELCELVPAFRRGGDGLDWEAGIPHREGSYTFSTTGTTTRRPLPGLSEEERRRHKGELVLPNLMVSLSADHVAAFTVWPRAAGRTSISCDFLFHPSEMEQDSFDPSDAVEFWDVVNRQDWAICEQVQDGMSSRRFSVGYLAPMEQPSADVGAYVRRRLGAGHG